MLAERWVYDILNVSFFYNSWFPLPQNKIINTLPDYIIAFMCDSNKMM